MGEMIDISRLNAAEEMIEHLDIERRELVKEIGRLLDENRRLNKEIERLRRTHCPGKR